MMFDVPESELANYHGLVARVDALCASTFERFAGQIRCRPGCDACCLHLSIFPVEAAVIAAQFRTLPLIEQQRIRALVQQTTEGESCPLLHEGLCQIYGVRPLICRTHGLPLMVQEEAGQRVDFCPENFQGLESLPADAVLSLDTLNQTLSAINAHFVANALDGDDSGRIMLRELILSI